MLKPKNFVDDVKLLLLWVFFVWLMTMVFAPASAAFPTGLLIFMTLFYALVRKAFAKTRSYADNNRDIENA